MRDLHRLVLICCLGLSSVFAQIQNARIEGTVQDSSGAVIPRAKLVIVNVRTQVRMDGGTDAAGSYFFPSLQPGFYVLTAEAG